MRNDEGAVVRRESGYCKSLWTLGQRVRQNLKLLARPRQPPGKQISVDLQHVTFIDDKDAPCLSCMHRQRDVRRGRLLTRAIIDKIVWNEGIEFPL